MTRAAPYLEIFLFALATILLEVSYTRVFSYKLLYYFTYVIIGIALLGLGTGGVMVALRRTLDRDDVARLVPGCALAAGGAGLAGYPGGARVPGNTRDMIGAPGGRAPAPRAGAAAELAGPSPA